MGWYAPQSCEETCCSTTMPSPCDKPVVTCRRTVDPQRFTYAVTNANEARIEERCTNPYGGVTYTSHEIELDESGNTSGEYYTLANCEYCVVATNECGTVVCCDECTQPRCFIDSATLQSDGSIRIAWRYYSVYNIIPGGFDSSGGDPLITATLNGVDILSNPLFAAGETYVAKADIPDVITMVLVNDCGKSTTCEYPVPCCWNKEQLRITLSGLADINRVCDETFDPVYNGSNQMMAFEAEISIAGLSAANGTYLFDIDDSACTVTATDEYYVGTIDLSWYSKETVRGPSFSSGIVTRVLTYKLEISAAELYVRRTGFFIKLPATGTITVTGNDIAFNAPIDPAYTPTVTFDPSRYWSFGMFSGASCPGGYGTGVHPVVGVNSGSSYGGWITGITGPGAFFINPTIVTTQAVLPFGACPGLIAHESFGVETEFLS